MTPERWQQVKTLLAAALERPAAERAAFLNEACASDASLRAEVESLLAYEDQPGSFIEHPVMDRETEQAARLTESPAGETPVTGRRIGPYQLRRELGHGGMGAVYLATRADDEYRQQVAIKLIRHGLDTDFILQRFRNERQILAVLDHPHIARLLDGGTTDDGLPYLVMEYIEGVPIDEYCDQHQLNTEERLTLFRHVCAAVHYAHQRLVIHRDIKPSNILVTEEGMPKLLDFGIAKLLTPELAAHTLDPTAPALRLMTPSYASPEQIRGEPITTASDVYSLGVVLYELLTGRSPYKPTSGAVHDLMHAVCESEPEKPSTAIRDRGSGIRDQGPAAREQRATDNGQRTKLARRLRGDLDNIVLMALRKEPDRRYASVEQFSEDIRRHLEGLPVIARPATIGYRASKFIQRHKAGVAATALIVVTLIGGMIGINQQRARAERRFQEVRKLARAVVFDYHDAIADLPGATPVRERLVKDALDYLDSLATEAEGDRTLQRELAAAYVKIGDVQGNSRVANLGDISGALRSYRKALAIRQALAETEPTNVEGQSELAESYERMGTILRDTGDASGAFENYRQAMMILERLSSTTPENAELRRKLAAAYAHVGDIKAWPRSPNLGDLAGGIEYYRKALAIRETLCAADPADAKLCAELQENHRTLADVLISSGLLADAEPHVRQALTLAQSLAAADATSVKARRTFIVSQDTFARWLERKGEPEKAIEVYRRLLDTAESMLTADPDNVQARTDLAGRHTRMGSLLMNTGDPVNALEYFRQALRLNETTAAADSNNDAARRLVAINYLDLGHALAQAGDLAGALRSNRQALAYFEMLMRKNPQDMHARPRLMRGYNQVGETLLKLGDWTAALEHFRQAVALAERAPAHAPAMSGTDRQVALSYFHIGETYAQMVASANTPRHQRPQHWRKARQAYQHSLELFQELQRKGALTQEYASKPDEITRAIARCDAALAKLNGQ